MRSCLLRNFIILCLIVPTSAMAEIEMGQVLAKSKDIDIVMFGSLKTLPHFIENADFNSDSTPLDFIIDEHGVGADHTIFNEFRIGWKAKGDSWDFLAILESDFVMNKANGDRGADGTHLNQFPFGDVGMTGEDFGVEKLNFGYDFGTAKLNVGWNTKWTDLMTGGLLYADDHPYIGLAGRTEGMKWELLYLIVQDDMARRNGGVVDGDSMDWRVYTLRTGFDLNGFTLAPIYAFSDNEDAGADTHYFGVEGYGKLGKIFPRFELIYAMGEQDGAGSDKDIAAWAAYASIEMKISKAFNPYIGGYYLTGDDDGTDDDIDAYNAVSCGARYTPTFGMENALVYRFVPALGTHIYSNNFNTLGSVSGYGGISNSSRGDAPGMVMLGIGAKGALNERVTYKTQLMYFAYEETGGIEKAYNKSSIDEEVGIEFDLQLTYKFSKHFSVGNVLSVFFPGDGIEDRLGDAYSDEAIMDTIELVWNF